MDIFNNLLSWAYSTVHETWTTFMVYLWFFYSYYYFFKSDLPKQSLLEEVGTDVAAIEVADLTARPDFL